MQVEQSTSGTRAKRRPSKPKQSVVAFNGYTFDRTSMSVEDRLALEEALSISIRDADFKRAVTLRLRTS